MSKNFAGGGKLYIFATQIGNILMTSDSTLLERIVFFIVLRDMK